MPESTCLHIQDHESGPIRVVDIPWISVRIGRAAFCEVRLIADDLADEACRLYRRGRSWHLVPAGARGKIVVDGKSVEATCPLPFDVPFRVGRHCLTLRQDRTVDPDWQMYPGSVVAERNRSKPPPKDVRPDPRRAARTTPIVESERVIEATFKPERHSHTTATKSTPTNDSAAGVSLKDRWQTRWRAAEAELKARNERLSARGETTRPSFTAGFESVPLREASVPRAQPREAPVLRPHPKEPPVARAMPKESPVARRHSQGTAGRPRRAQGTAGPPSPAQCTAGRPRRARGTARRPRRTQGTAGRAPSRWNRPSPAPSPSKPPTASWQTRGPMSSRWFNHLNRRRSYRRSSRDQSSRFGNPRP